MQRHLIPTSSKFLHQSDFFFKLLTCLLWTFTSCFSISRLSPAKESQVVSNSLEVQTNSIHRMGWDVEVNDNVSFKKCRHFYILLLKCPWKLSRIWNKLFILQPWIHDIYLLPHLKLMKLTSWTQAILFFLFKTVIMFKSIQSMQFMI